jgi:Ca2+-binding EF-hand superfamily protein
VKFDENTIHLLFHFLDKNRDSAINYEEFLTSILSRNDNQLRAIVSQKDTFYIGNKDYLSYDVEYCLAKIYETELYYIQQFVDYSLELRKCVDFNENYAFKLIDYYDHGQIQEEGLEHFLRKKGYFVNKNELKSILNRMDSDGDNIVSFQDFVEFLFVNEEIANNETYLRKSVMGNTIQSRVNKSFNNFNTLQQQNTSDIPIKKQFGNISRISDNKTLKNTFEDINFMSTLNSYTSPKENNNKFTSTLTNFSSSRFSHISSPPVSSPVRLSMRSISPRTNSKTVQNSRKCDLIIEIIAKHLNEVLLLENKLEKDKQSLSFRNDFKVNEIFSNFDISLKGYITPINFLQVITNLGVASIYTLDDVKRIYRRYDYELNGKMT